MQLARKRILLVSLIFAALMSGSFSWAQISFTAKPVGQWNGHSCQSYALAVALAKAQGRLFGTMTAQSLREIEIGIRNAILMSAVDKNDIRHSDIKRGLEQYTNGAFTIEDTRVDGIVSLSERVARETGVTKAAFGGLFVIDSQLNSAILTSVNSIKGQGNWGGHIVAILGVLGPSNSSQKLLVLNSGDNQNKPDARFTCESHLPDKASKYSAHIAWVPVSDIGIKAFEGKSGPEFLAWKVVKK